CSLWTTAACWSASSRPPTCCAAWNPCRTTPDRRRAAWPGRFLTLFGDDMMKNLCRALVVLVLAAGAFVPAGRGDDVDKPSKTAELMKKKLKHSQGILEGIALNDFDKIADNADQLIAISQQAEWVVVK